MSFAYWTSRMSAIVPKRLSVRKMISSLFFALNSFFAEIK